MKIIKRFCYAFSLILFTILSICFSTRSVSASTLSSGTYTVQRIKQDKSSDKYTVALQHKSTVSVEEIDSKKYPIIKLTEKSDKLQIKTDKSGKITDITNQSMKQSDKKSEEKKSKSKSESKVERKTDKESVSDKNVEDKDSDDADTDDFNSTVGGILLLILPFWVLLIVVITFLSY